MAKEFELSLEVELPATPDTVWAAITTPQTEGWLWRIDYEPRLGGAERGLTSGGGAVTAWEPDRRFATRAEKPGWFNQLEYELEPRGDATGLRFRHTTEFEDDTFARQSAACLAHTDFYYHSLGEYVRHFAGRPVTYVTADGPPASTAPGSFAAARRALGVPDGAQAGDRVQAVLPGAGRVEATVDYLTEEFLGLRTDDALYRIYGRDAWGWPVGAAHHLFRDDVDGAAAERAWNAWLGGLFAEAA